MSQKSFSRFSWKLPHILILIWRIEKLKTFSHIFSPSSSFLPQLVKNVLKIGWKRFSTDFLENCYYNLIGDMDNSKIKLIFQKTFVFIFVFVLISQKWLKKPVKQFFLRFSWKFLYNLIWIWKIQKSNSFFQIFLSSSLSSSSFLSRLVKNVLQNETKKFFSDFHENCYIT